MIRGVQEEFLQLALAECRVGGLLPTITDVLFSMPDKQLPTKYPYLCLEWNGASGLQWSGAGQKKRAITFNRNKVLVSLFARGKQDLAEADRALMDALFTERTGDGVGQYDSGLLPFLDRLACYGLRTPNGDGWGVFPGEDLLSAKIAGLVNTPFCVGAAILVEFKTMGEIRTPAPS